MISFPGWDSLPAAPTYPVRLRDMHALYRVAAGHTCGQCVHLVTYHQSSTWFKCTLTVQTASSATDWRKRWPACGAFEPAA